MRIPFNRPAVGPVEFEYMRAAVAAGHLSGDGAFTKRCHAWLEHRVGAHKALLTHSCTAALEISAILADIGPGDEVIMPSYTFVSTANAFVLRGGVPVFVDVDRDTLNIDAARIEAAVTPRTRAVAVVHYAGVGCEMDQVLDIARRRDLLVIEDAAQGLMARYRGRALGSIGHLAALSFHETKNVVAGEGGALLVNDARFAMRAEIVREKGTNRGSFFRGEVDKYTWVDVGSSYLPSDMIAAFLLAQMEQADELTRRRLAIWNCYHDAFAGLEERGLARRPRVPAHCEHNAHMYYLILPTQQARAALIASLRGEGIGAIFHYVPLHSSPAGRRYGRAHGPLTVTDEVSDGIVRLPLWPGVEAFVEEIVAAVHRGIERAPRPAR